MFLEMLGLRIGFILLKKISVIVAGILGLHFLCKHKINKPKGLKEEFTIVAVIR